MTDHAASSLPLDAPDHQEDPRPSSSSPVNADTTTTMDAGSSAIIDMTQEGMVDDDGAGSGEGTTTMVIDDHGGGSGITRVDESKKEDKVDNKLLEEEKDGRKTTPEEKGMDHNKAGQPSLPQSPSGGGGSSGSPKTVATTTLSSTTEGKGSYGGGKKSALRPYGKRRRGKKTTPVLTSTSKFKGVSWNYAKSHAAEPWEAIITIDGQTEHLGFFFTEREAAEAYNKRARERDGDKSQEASDYQAEERKREGVEVEEEEEDGGNEDESDSSSNTTCATTVSAHYRAPWPHPWEAFIDDQSLGFYRTSIQAARAYDHHVKRHVLRHHSTHQEARALVLNFPYEQEGLMTMSGPQLLPPSTANHDDQMEQLEVLSGVRFHSMSSAKPWRAVIMRDGRMEAIGDYATEMEAQLAYKQHANSLLHTMFTGTTSGGGSMSQPLMTTTPTIGGGPSPSTLQAFAPLVISRDANA